MMSLYLLNTEYFVIKHREIGVEMSDKYPPGQLTFIVLEDAMQTVWEKIVNSLT